jgi:murein DD-endopeptidase MepM/ murein hydrolase activator NlpD
MLLATAMACALLLAAPGTAPRGQVLDLVSKGGPSGGNAVGQEPAPGGSPAPGPAVEGTPPPDERPAGFRHGVPPERTLTEADGPTAPPISALEDYVWPIAHPRLTLPFGPTGWGNRVVDGQLFHDGVDLATFCGDRISAAHRGTVIAAGRRFDTFLGWVGDLGPYFTRLDEKGLWMALPIVVVIDDGNGYRSMYAHFNRIVVKVGQHVDAGQLLGYEGATGHATGCHLHYGLFSPWERATFGISPDVVKRMLVPDKEIARIDPLLVLPPKPGINAPATPRPSPAQTPSPVAPSPQP